MNKYGARVSACKTPASMLNSSVSPSGDRTFARAFSYSFAIRYTVSFQDLEHFHSMDAIESLTKVQEEDNSR